MHYRLLLSFAELECFHILANLRSHTADLNSVLISYIDTCQVNGLPRWSFTPPTHRRTVAMGTTHCPIYVAKGVSFTKHTALAINLLQAMISPAEGSCRTAGSAPFLSYMFRQIAQDTEDAFPVIGKFASACWDPHRVTCRLLSTSKLVMHGQNRWRMILQPAPPNYNNIVIPSLGFSIENPLLRFHYM